MRNVTIFPKLSRVRVYQLKVTLLLTLVPVVGCSILTAFEFFFAQQNLFFLEAGGLIINEEIGQAYHDQLRFEVLDVVWYLVLLISLTFPISFVFVGWATSPFVNAEKLLRASLKDKDRAHKEIDYLSESPAFHKVIWNFAQTLRDKNHPFDNFPPAQYEFNFRYFFKLVLGFYVLSVISGYLLGIVFDAIYLKIVSLAINLVRINRSGHFFLAQQQLLHSAVTLVVAMSCLAHWVTAFYVTRYLSNMTFVFTRAVREHHFPLRLRHSDIYHSLADAISDVAETAGLSKK